MSDEKAPARPRQITMAAVMAVVGSAVLVLSLFDSLGRLRTPETRRAIDDFLAEPPGSGLGLETGQVVEVMRMLTYVSGALAATVLVFAVYVLQRHRAARIGLTVTAGLLLVTVPVAGLLPLFIAVAALLVWSQPAREWYSGRTPAVAGGPNAGGGPLLSQSDEPPRQEGWPPQGQPQQWAYPPAYGQAPGPGTDPALGQGAPPGYGMNLAGQRPQDKRPTTVTFAAVLTWIGSGVVAALMLLFALVLAAGSDALVDEVDQVSRDAQVELSADAVLATAWVVVAIVLLWSLASSVLAVFAFRRSNVARILLAISAGLVALLSLLLLFPSGVTAVTLLLAGATLVLLFTGGANQWYSRRSAGGGHGYPGGYPGYPSGFPGSHPSSQPGAYPGGDPGAQQQHPGFGEPEERQEKERPW